MIFLSFTNTFSYASRFASICISAASCVVESCQLSSTFKMFSKSAMSSLIFASSNVSPPLRHSGILRHPCERMLFVKITLSLSPLTPSFDMFF